MTVEEYHNCRTHVTAYRMQTTWKVDRRKVENVLWRLLRHSMERQIPHSLQFSLAAGDVHLLLLFAVKWRYCLHPHQTKLSLQLLISLEIPKNYAQLPCLPLLIRHIGRRCVQCVRLPLAQRHVGASTGCAQAAGATERAPVLLFWHLVIKPMHFAHTQILAKVYAVWCYHVNYSVTDMQDKMQYVSWHIQQRQMAFCLAYWIVFHGRQI